MPMIIINGELAEQFSYDEAGLMQALQTYAAAKAQGAEVDFVVDITQAGPDVGGIMEQIAPFMVPYQGSQEMLEVNVEELAGSAMGEGMSPNVGGPPPPGAMPPGANVPGGGMPPGAAQGPGAGMSMAQGPGGPPPPGMSMAGGPMSVGTPAPGTGGDREQAAGGASPEGQLSEHMVAKAGNMVAKAGNKIIRPRSKKDGMPV
jgi:hypothetical protein